MKQYVKPLCLLMALGFVASACNDDNNANECNANDKPVCVSDSEYKWCADGSFTTTPCKSTEICSNGACIDKSADYNQTCNKDTFTEKCVGTGSHTSCVNGLVSQVACNSGEVCNNDKCEPVKADTENNTEACNADSYTPTCASNTSVKKCVNGQIKTVNCDNNQTCDNGSCSAKQDSSYEITDEACTPGESVCYDDQKVKSCVGNVFYIVKCSKGCNKTLNRCDDGTGTTDPNDPGVIGGDTNECKLGTAAYCESDNVAVTCEDGYLFDDSLNPLGKVIKQHCTDGTTCVDGVCKIDSSKQCFATACKDRKTLTKCEGGVPTDVPCGANELCVSDTCVDYTGVTTCSSDSDCASTETCRDSICYSKENLALKVGDPCDFSTFQEYCDNGDEIKCGDEDYNYVVYKNPCTGYNGCSVTVKKAYNPDKTVKKAVLNAMCRGTEAELANCTKPGVISNECINIQDSYFSYSYSFTNACEVGTDGQMIFIQLRDETSCNDNNTCNEATGLCSE